VDEGDRDYRGSFGAQEMAANLEESERYGGLDDISGRASDRVF